MLPMNLPPKSKPPELLELRGEQFQSYSAGQHFGIMRGLNDAAANVQTAKHHYESQFTALRDALHEALPVDHELQVTIHALPALAGLLTTMAAAFASKASEHQTAGNAALGALARSKAAERVWWKSPRFVGWLGYMVAVTLGAVSAAVGAGYAIRHGW